MRSSTPHGAANRPPYLTLGNLCSGPTGSLPGRTDLPYFWSDQFGLRLQHVGYAEGPTTTELEDGDSFTARYRDPDGRLVAALAVNRPREAGPLRRELAGEATAAAA